MSGGGAPCGSPKESVRHTILTHRGRYRSTTQVCPTRSFSGTAGRARGHKVIGYIRVPISKAPPGTSGGGRQMRGWAREDFRAPEAETSLRRTISASRVTTVGTRKVRRSSVITPAKTELSGCFSARSGRARAVVSRGARSRVTLCRPLAYPQIRRKG